MNDLFAKTTLPLWAGALIFLYACAGLKTGPAAESYTIPIGGNTYLTSGALNQDKVSARGITAWTDAASVFSTYFKTDKAGKVRLQLALEPGQLGRVDLSPVGPGGLDAVHDEHPDESAGGVEGVVGGAVGAVLLGGGE